MSELCDGFKRNEEGFACYVKGEEEIPIEGFLGKKEDFNGVIFLLREPNTDAQHEFWFKETLKPGSSKKTGISTKMENRFKEMLDFIKKEQTLSDCIYCNLWPCSGEKIKSKTYKDVLKEIKKSNRAEDLEKIIEKNRNEHDIYLFTCGDIYEVLKKTWNQYNMKEYKQEGLNYNDKRKSYFECTIQGGKINVYEIKHPSRGATIDNNIIMKLFKDVEMQNCIYQHRALLGVRDYVEMITRAPRPIHEKIELLKEYQNSLESKKAKEYVGEVIDFGRIILDPVNSKNITCVSKEREEIVYAIYPYALNDNYNYMMLYYGEVLRLPVPYKEGDIIHTDGQSLEKSTTFIILSKELNSVTCLYRNSDGTISIGDLYQGDYSAYGMQRISPQYIMEKSDSTDPLFKKISEKLKKDMFWGRSLESKYFEAPQTRLKEEDVLKLI